MSVLNVEMDDEVDIPIERIVEDLDANIKWLHRCSNRDRARMLAAVAEFDEEGYADFYGESSTATWLQRELNLPNSTAYEYVRVARGLRRFPLLFEVFQSGIMPYRTVRFLLNYMTEDNEEELIDLAVSLAYSELTLCLAGADTHSGKEPEEPFVDTRVRDDGMLLLTALLPPVAGQEALCALKIAQLALHGLSGDEQLGSVPPEELDELIRQAAAEDEECPGEQVKTSRDTKLTADRIMNPVSRFGPPPRSELYDAFMAMVGMVRSAPMSPLRSPGAQVNIMVTEDGRCWMPENQAASSDEIKHYVGNALTRIHTLSSQGLTLNVGRAKRLATDGQVQALLAVWGYQCAMPGCSHRRFIQIHHIREWEKGGSTDIDNLIPLCSSCHSRVSHGLVSIKAVGHDIFFEFLDGALFVSQNRGVPQRRRNSRGPVVEPKSRDGLSFADG